MSQDRPRRATILGRQNQVRRPGKESAEMDKVEWGGEAEVASVNGDFQGSSNIELVERYPGSTIAQSMSLDLAL